MVIPSCGSVRHSHRLGCGRDGRTCVPEDRPSDGAAGRPGPRVCLERPSDLWGYLNDVTLDSFRLGKPADSPLINAFHDRFQTVCLTTNWFLQPSSQTGELP